MENYKPTLESIFSATEHELLTLSLSEIVNGLKKENTSNKRGKDASITHSCMLYAEGLRLANTHPELAKKLILASLFDINVRAAKWLMSNGETKMVEMLLKNELTFNKTKGCWYIDLPEWDGSTEDLAMVNGADRMLDIIASKQGKDEVTLKVWLCKPDVPCISISKIAEDAQGATYQVNDYPEYNGTVWLCNVTKFVFLGFHPETIYFSVK